MPQGFIAAPTPVWKDKMNAFTMGTKLITRISNAAGVKNAHPVRLFLLSNDIFFDGLLKETPSFFASSHVVLEEKGRTAG
jgi:hypothetical protein